MKMSQEEFEAAVSEALDRMPAELAELMDNVVIQVHELPARRTLVDLELDPAHHTLFGLYTGVPLDVRGGGYGNVLPDVIELYRQPLMAACRTRAGLVRQIQLTLLHEIGHHFGFSDREMEAWEGEFSGLDGAE